MKRSYTGDILSNQNSFIIEENKILEIITKDIKRTHPDIKFFEEKSKNNKKETNFDVIKRMLFIFARKYPEISYVQGLNEILANIFYVFS